MARYFCWEREWGKGCCGYEALLAASVAYFNSCSVEARTFCLIHEQVTLHNLRLLTCFDETFKSLSMFCFFLFSKCFCCSLYWVERQTMFKDWGKRPRDHKWVLPFKDWWWRGGGHINHVTKATTKG